MNRLSYKIGLIAIIVMQSNLLAQVFMADGMIENFMTSGDNSYTKLDSGNKILCYDGLLTSFEPIQITSGTLDSKLPRLASDGQFIYLTWEKSNNEIYWIKTDFIHALKLEIND